MAGARPKDIVDFWNNTSRFWPPPYEEKDRIKRSLLKFTRRYHLNVKTFFRSFREFCLIAQWKANYRNFKKYCFRYYQYVIPANFISDSESEDSGAYCSTSSSSYDSEDFDP